MFLNFDFGPGFILLQAGEYDMCQYTYPGADHIEKDFARNLYPDAKYLYGSQSTVDTFTLFAKDIFVYGNDWDHGKRLDCLYPGMKIVY